MTIVYGLEKKMEKGIFKKIKKKINENKVMIENLK